MLKRILQTCLAGCVAWMLLIAPSVAADRANLVLILADDLGYGDLHCYGRTDIQTPVLDSLASQGVRFTNHYANGPECTPTRTALLTGRYQQWVGGLECAIGTGNVGRYDDAIRLREQDDLGLPTQQQTIVRLLRDAGYHTAITGKWHLGYEPEVCTAPSWFRTCVLLHRRWHGLLSLPGHSGGLQPVRQRASDSAGWLFHRLVNR